MNIKTSIKKIIPYAILCKARLYLEEKRSNQTYPEIEASIDATFEHQFGKKVDWDNPTSYNEKLQVSKLYAVSEDKIQLTDKIAVEEWVKRRLGSSDDCHFIPLIAAYDSVDDIDFSQLPEKYVIKMNNDSGSALVIDKDRPFTERNKKEYKYYFQKRNYAYVSYELQYRDIKPKIMIQKYMGHSIRDYKFACFNGKVVSCRVDFDRFGNHTRNIYDKNWTLLPYNKGEYTNNPKTIKKPANFEKMWKLASKLSKGFDQVRVDFYDIDGKIYFGEMTFTNGNGVEAFHPNDYDEKMGQEWKLDMDAISERRKKLLKLNTKIKDVKF